MHRPAVGVTLALLTLVLGGCNLINERTSSATTDDSQTNAAPAPAPAPVPEAFEASEQPTEDLNSSPLALTRPTNPDERRLVIKRGRLDPFKSLVPEPSPSSPTLSRPRSSAPSALERRRRARPNSTAKTALGPTTPKPKPTTTPKISNPSSPIPLPKPSLTPDKVAIKLPTLPEAEAAKGIQVQGIVTLGDPQAIVLAPEETTPRSVSVGQRLSQGRVLVKGFDLSDPNAPLVIFEEAGTEVAAGVGQEGYIIASATP